MDCPSTPSAVRTLPARLAPPVPTTRWRLQLLGAWVLSHNGIPRDVPTRDQRLIGYLAICGPAPRSVIAGTLWPDTSDSGALSSLRTTTAHIRHQTPGVLSVGRADLGLSADLSTDIRDFRVTLARTEEEPPVPAIELARGLLLYAELFPGCYDDWVLSERDQLWRATAAALNAVTAHLVTAEELALALVTAQLVAHGEPLMESAQRLLATVHLLQGDRIAALRVFQEFGRRSIKEFGLAPSAHFHELIGPLQRERQARHDASPSKS